MKELGNEKSFLQFSIKTKENKVVTFTEQTTVFINLEAQVQENKIFGGNFIETDE